MKKKLLVSRLALGLPAVGAVVLFSAFARADQCGSVTAGWNVPAGGAVLIRDGGIIHDLLTTLGEVRSHSMLSHGPGGWVTHATSSDPPTQAECSLPIDTSFLRASTPGLSTIDQGAAYTFIYGNGGTPGNVWYQRSNRPQAGIPNADSNLANTFLPTNEFGDQFTYHTMGGGANTVFGIDFSYNNGGQLGTPGQIYYGWNQYMNIGSTAQGFPAGNQQGYGVVCSTALAMWQHDALWNTPGYTGDIRPRTYASSAITNAAWTLFNDIYNRCSNGLSVNLSSGSQSLGAVWAATCFGQSVCGNAADEMVNTFANGNSESDQQGDWVNKVQNSSAVSISPDDIGCWNNNNTGPGCVGAGSSVWGWDTNNDVQWNSGGNSYGCWAQ